MTTDATAGFSALAERLGATTVRVIDGRNGAGSGVIWPGRGTIVTNAHVVRSLHATVAFADGRRARAVLIDRDPECDLALLRIDGALPAGLTAATVRDERTLRAGELLVAVGNPYGLVGALSAGIFRGHKGRWVVADLRLAPGNSGGPLADAEGHVVGINSMVANGLALAVPSGTVGAFLTSARAA